jgi:hypothetical protein
MAEKRHISIDQGSDFELVLNLSDANTLNLLSYSCNAAIRKHYTSTNAVAFVAETTANGVVLTLPANTTSELTGGRYVYDCIITSPTDVVTRVVEGVVTVNPSVTR